MSIQLISAIVGMVEMLSLNEKKLLDFYLEEDAGKGDPTGLLVPDKIAAASVISRQACIVSGIEEAIYIFRKNRVTAKPLAKDGSTIHRGQAILAAKGNARGILRAERMALNILGRMSAVTSAAGKAVKIAKPYGVTIAVTRKTMPGFMHFDKKAAEIAGCWVHRENLGKAILIKDNHLAVHGNHELLLKKAVEMKKKGKLKFIEIEADTMEQAIIAVKTSVDIIMLDNFSPSKAKKTVKTIRELGFRGKIELSGGINLSNLRAYCKAQPGIISMGSITRGCGMLDFSPEAEFPYGF